ncbi:MAG: 4Fe-4S binding protein [Bacteroidales bacterium]|nr:4Fe-4S binding protein [Bacteroidales bacterium]
MKICDYSVCTGCGACANICPTQAIKMTIGLHDFIYPHINNELCCNCGLCSARCPANAKPINSCNVNKVYAAWNKNKQVRANSSSGGVFNIIAEKIISDFGVVAGAKWTNNFHPEHCLIENKEKLFLLNGSKYVQSDTANIYSEVKDALKKGKNVLFSGTPCQNHALKSYLGKEYNNLYQIDLVCHGVPSYDMLCRHICEIKSSINKVVDIKFRYKNPYWDYCSVKIDFTDGSSYVKYTSDDSYFTLFNIGYSLRDSCRQCKYTNTYRYGDITLGDYWGYSPNSSKMRDFQKGISLILVNSLKGEEILDRIKGDLIIEPSTLNQAIKGNRSLKMPFSPPEGEVNEFWIDYENGMTVDELCKKYVPTPYVVPKLLWLRRLKRKYKWVIKKSE